MKMVIKDELQALLLLSSLPNSWETFVVTMSNSAPDGKLSMGQVSSSLFNEEIRRKLAGTNNAQALVSENRGRSKNRGHKGYGKSKGRSQSTERGKYYHCGKDGHLKRNCYAWKREQKKENNNQKKNEEKNTTATFEGDEVVVLSCGEEEGMHVGNEIVWVADTGASYHATSSKEFFTSYKAEDFSTLKMEYAENGGEVQEEPVRDQTPLMTDDMPESDNEVEMPEEETIEQGEQTHQQEPVEPQVRRSTRAHRPSTKYSSSEYIMLTDEGELESF
ncbi:hypothetical protein F0562_027703 [Nyssa sinensis]|uniref:CCHC-type domain-containing protein n=1 Tax=Nyssa sinensis TaxID=561372 RepID=A0A5J5B4C6_9ASTE|nr:hypothetical protein F0562_027703 [Nyssa sinensis]